MPARTYQDAIEHLADVFQFDRAGRIQRNMRRAVEEAYRELSQQGYWSYYRRRAILATAASQQTGTIAYDNSTRIVTLTGSTFPSNAQAYRLIIGNTHYDIASRTDSTHLVLSEQSNPGADVASGTSYTLYRSEYLLPTDFRRLLNLYDTSQRRMIEIIEDSTEQMLQVAALWSPGVPLYAAIRNTGETLDRLSLIFTAPPVDARNYDIMYDARPRPFVIPESYSDGTVSVSSGSTALTGTSTVFPSNCAGCVIRFSANADDLPTGPYGALVNNMNRDNPYAFQTTIASYTSATSVTLTDAAPAAFSGVKYTLSDPLDLEDGAMYTAFLRLAEWHFATVMNIPKSEWREAAAQKAVLMAKENDKRSLDKRMMPIITQQYFTLSTTEG